MFTNLAARGFSSSCRIFPRPVLALCLFAACLVAPLREARAQFLTGSPDLVISQIYTRGGEAGATFRNDYIELFNRGAETVNLAEYSLYNETTFDGAQTTGLTSFASTSSIPIPPGTYILIQFGSGGNIGTFFPVTPDFGAFLPPNFPHLNTVGRIALVKTRDFITLGCPAGQDPGVVDLIGYGGAACGEGAAPVSGPPSNSARARKSAGCTDTDNNASDFDLLSPPAPRNRASPTNVCSPPATTDTFQFEAAQLDVAESAGSVEIFVTRAGNTAAPAAVQYGTVNALASSMSAAASDRQDYTTAIGTLRFDAGETRKSFRLLLTDDARNEGLESLNLLLGNPTGGVALGAQKTLRVNLTSDDPSTSQPNPIDATEFFVRQHYHDFLNREPDAPGLQFWSDQIEQCGADAQCREVRRINVSAAFFLSIEFQETGYLAYRFFKAAFPNSLSRPRGFPTYREFIRDTQEAGRGVAVGVGNWEAQLEANKRALADEFVARPEFRLRYPSGQTAAQYVDLLNQTSGVALSQAERDALVAGLEAGTETRATALRRVAEDEDFKRAEFNRAFVLMQYFGYLRRGPNDPPDFNFDGYDFWLQNLNQFNGNFIEAEMVKAFISSIEYRQRFGQ